MGFIIKEDLLRQIKDQELEILTEDGGYQELLNSMMAAQEEVASYIRHAYDVGLAMPDLIELVPGETYSEGALVWVNAGDWATEASYSIGDLVAVPSPGVGVYVSLTNSNTANSPVSTPAHWSLFAPLDATIYRALEDTSALQTDITAWQAQNTDPRQQKLVQLVVDVALYDLHSRIKPRQIPEHRIQRRDDAISYLRDIADPRKNVLLNIPLKEHAENSGTDITTGQSDASQFSY